MRITANLQEPFATQMRNHEKIDEARLNRDKWAALDVDDEILFNGNLLVRVVGRRLYPTFRQMLLGEGLSNVLPGLRSIDEGVQLYHSLYTVRDEQTYGVVAFRVVVV